MKEEVTIQKAARDRFPNSDLCRTGFEEGVAWLYRQLKVDTRSIESKVDEMLAGMWNGEHYDVAPAEIVALIEQEVGASEDKREGLEGDLDNAIEVALKRGATEWTRLNYPKHYERLSAVGVEPVKLTRLAIRTGGSGANVYAFTEADDDGDYVFYTEAVAALEAALSTDAEPVAWYWEKSGSVHLALDRPDVRELAEIVGYSPKPLYAEPVKTAPAVAVKAGEAAEKLQRALDAANPNHKTMWVYVDDLRSALSAQVHDVAVPEYKYRIEYDYRSYVEKKTMWGLYGELGAVPLEEAQAHLQRVRHNNPGNFRLMRQPIAKWEEAPASPAPKHGEEG